MKIPKRIAAIDTETTGLNPYSKTTHATVNSYWDSRKRYKVYKIPDEDPVLVRMACENPKVLKLFWNAAFDIPILQKQGIKVRGPVIDCMFMAEMGYPEERRHSLKHFSRKFLHDDYKEEVRLRSYVRKNKINVRREGYGAVPDHLLLPYAVKDARNTFALFGHLRKRIDEHGLWPHLALEMRLLARVVLPMQSRGFLIDTDEATSLYKCGKKEVKSLRHSLSKAVGESEFNPNSPIQVAAALYDDDNGVPILRYSKGGQPATSELALLEIIRNEELPKKWRTFSSNLLRYRKLDKAVNTYFGNVREAVDDNRIFRVSFNQTRARTGRFSSSGYDIKGQLQNIPRTTHSGVLGSVRNIFVARPGYRLVCIDLDQVEMRIQAHFLEDEEMIHAIKSGEDLHNLACRRYLHREPDKIYRYAAKTLNYAGTYGAGASQFQDTVFKESNGEIAIDYETASMAVENFRATTAPLGELVAEQVGFSGGVFDFYGRWIGVDENAIYAGVNYLIQGTAAGYLKRKMFKVADILRGRKTKLLAQVHDELIFEVYHSEKHLVPKLKRAMEDHKQFLVPITASVSWGKSWGSKRPLELAS